MNKITKIKVSKILYGFGIVWTSMVILSAVIGTIGVVIAKGIISALFLFNPFNLLNYLVILVAIAPGAVALFISEKLKEEKHET